MISRVEADLRDWQLDLLKRLIAAEDKLAAEGQRDDFVVHFFNQGTFILHRGLAGGQEETKKGDLKALRASGVLFVITESEHGWSAELSSQARAVAEAEDEARGTPSAATQLAELRRATADQDARRAERRLALAESLAQPVRWLVFVLLAVLAGLVAVVSFRATDQPAAPLVALALLGVLWGLAERLFGWHVTAAASRAHAWTAKRIDRWLATRLGD
jgi:hypothetical protein